MKRKSGLCLILLWLVPWIHLLAASASDKPITVGVLAHLGVDTAKQMWTPTIGYLAEQIPELQFELQPLDLHEMSASLERGELDFILTNPGHYVELEARHGISRIATLKNQWQGEPYEVFGAVIITRADRDDIRHLADLRNKSFAGVDKAAFGGFQMAWRELREAGIDPFNDFTELRFLGFPQKQIVFAVRDAGVDAGTVRAEVLERLASQGRIDLADFRILNSRQYSGFPFSHSTRLYPEWAFAKARPTPDELAKDVMIALMQMPADHPVALAGDFDGWTVPLDYHPVHELFQELEIGPYLKDGEVTLAAVIRQYWYWLVLMLFVILLSVSLNILVKRQVVRRTVELTREVSERKRAEEESQVLLQENRFLIRKSLAVQEGERRYLARELHDELGQCIVAIQADAAIIRERVGDCDPHMITSATAIQEVSSRIYEVVHSMMQRLRPSVLDDLGLIETLKEEVDAWQTRQPDTVYALTFKGDLSGLGEETNITIYRIVQECLTNIAKHASAHLVSISLEADGAAAAAGETNLSAGHIRLEVADDGAGFDTTARRRGLGLIGMRERVEGLGGKFSIQSQPGEGTTLVVALPLTPAESGAS